MQNVDDLVICVYVVSDNRKLKKLILTGRALIKVEEDKKEYSEYTEL